jgi:hypothetical protein
MSNDGDNGYHGAKNSVLKAAQFAKLEQISTNSDGNAAQWSGKF